ncbi:hypothetical protein IAU59_007490 [Kwoniella sp. CBS 9459]
MSSNQSESKSAASKAPTSSKAPSQPTTSAAGGTKASWQSRVPLIDGYGESRYTTVEGNFVESSGYAGRGIDRTTGRVSTQPVDMLSSSGTHSPNVAVAGVGGQKVTWKGTVPSSDVKSNPT